MSSFESSPNVSPKSLKSPGRSSIPSNQSVEGSLSEWRLTVVLFLLFRLEVDDVVEAGGIDDDIPPGMAGGVKAEMFEVDLRLWAAVDVDDDVIVVLCGVGNGFSVS